MFHLVSKIISWKTKSQDSHSMQSKNKISIDEWQSYQTHLLDISKTEGVEVVKKKLQKIFTAIQEHGGFL